MRVYSEHASFTESAGPVTSKLLMLHRGGWQADGKGASIWDTFCHQEGRVLGGQSGDVSCNSYQLWDQDLDCIKQLGLTHYRLSFSWPRLLPDGTTGHVNQEGASIPNFFCGPV